jgi:hypothetical protein
MLVLNLQRLFWSRLALTPVVEPAVEPVVEPAVEID